MKTAMIVTSTVTAPTRTGLAMSELVPGRFVTAPAGSRVAIDSVTPGLLLAAPGRVAVRGRGEALLAVRTVRPAVATRPRCPAARGPQARRVRRYVRSERPYPTRSGP